MSTAVVYTPLLAQLNKRQYPVTTDQLNSLLAGASVVTFSSLTQALAPYLLISSLGRSLAPYVTTATLASTLATFGALAGTNIWTGKEFFKDSPWADVRAFGATGNGSTDDTVAVQAAIDHMNTAYGAGFVFFPSGSYKTSSVLTVKGGVILMGSGSGGTEINGSGQDVTVVAFDSSASYAGIRDIVVVGFLSAAATKDAVTVANGIVANILNSRILGGRYAFQTGGVNGRMLNCFVMGFTGGVLTSGANWYTDTAFDDPGGFSPTYAFHKIAYYTTGVAEDQIVDCDFAINGAASVFIDDGGTQAAITKFLGCVFASPISIANHKWTAFVGCEIGSTLYTLTAINPVTFVGCYGFFNATLAGANVILSGNYNIVP